MPWQTIDERFWSRVKKAPTCWLWTGSKVSHGYGRFSYHGVWLKAHRFAWVGANGPIPERGVIAHHCDTPLCVRPDHLFLTDLAGNNADMKAKGRAASGDRNGSRTHPEAWQPERHISRAHPQALARGERHGMTTLTEHDVRSIRLAHAEGFSMATLSRTYNVSKVTVFNIVHRRTWGHVV